MGEREQLLRSALTVDAAIPARELLRPTVVQGGNQHAQRALHRDRSGGTVLKQRAGGGRTSVTVATTRACSDERGLAQAIPGARAMAETAVNWFISLNSRDVARVDALLRANFHSAADDVRFTVLSRLLRIRTLLGQAQSGQLTFDCVPDTHPDCPGNNGFVRSSERGVIHLCGSFFNQRLEGRRWTLIHECAHLAGAMVTPEAYHSIFGPVTDAHCTSPALQASTSDALGNADNYARLVWCLTRPANTVVTPP